MVADWRSTGVPVARERLFSSVILLLTLVFSVPCGAQEVGDFEQLNRQFLNPSVRHTQMPFWFWNGDIQPDRLKNQISEMESHGVKGFVIHARIGLSPEVGYMTDRWLSLVRTAVEEAQRRDMIVYLYDEGMYPSGSAHGRVTEGRPDLASQGLRMISRRVRGPQALQLGVPLESGEELVTVVQMQWAEAQQKYLGQTARIISGADARIPSGEWGLFIFIQTPSGGVIRGVHWDEEDNASNAPASADLLNPEVAERFIRYTHEPYHEAVGQYFGTTVKGIFTDEPSILGRRAKHGLQPWTTGLDRYASEILGYDFRVALPFLFGAVALDGREEAIAFDFADVLQQRLNEAYYRPLSEWCELHGIALTGHPAGAGDQEAQELFQHPGQDVVWRWVLPGETAVEGEQSTSAKSAASAGAQLDREYVINEAYGAYGWRLTMDEMKWLADWLFVRGTNRLLPHAFYYSDQPPRLYERPPDLSWYNLWWDHYGQFAKYTDRLSWLQTDSQPIVEVAVLRSAENTPWKAARQLLENQIDYHYLSLGGLSNVDNGQIGRARYLAIVVDGDLSVSSSDAGELNRIAGEGLPIILFGGKLSPHMLRPDLSQTTQSLRSLSGHENVFSVDSNRALLELLRELIPIDVKADPPAPDLRYAHVKKEGHDFYLLTNEGEKPITTRLFVAQAAFPEIWDAETGARSEVAQGVSLREGISFQLNLGERSSTILAFDVFRPAIPNRSRERISQETVLELPSVGWRILAEGRSLDADQLGSWTEIEGMETWSGEVTYRYSIQIPEHLRRDGGRVLLDCGEAAAFVSVGVNGDDAGTRLWQPYMFDLTDLVRAGDNQLDITVTNTRANELTSEQFPSGLFGPVRVILKWEEER